MPSSVPEVRRAWLKRAAALGIAAWLSFAIASLLHVEHAFWAAMPTWVLAQSSRGLVIERALFRLLGTLIGAGVGLAVLWLPVPLELKCLLLAGWIGLQAALTQLMRGASGYLALMAGITAGVVLIPALISGADTTAIAYARIDCTVIGVIVSSIVLAIATPSSPISELYARIHSIGQRAQTLAAGLFDPAPPSIRSLRHFLADLGALDAGTRQSVAGSLEGYRRLPQVDHLLVSSLDLLAAALALRNAGVRPPADILPGVTDSGRPIAPADDPALVRLREARAYLQAPPANPPPGMTPHPLLTLAPHREWWQALRQGLFAATVSLAILLLARLTHWTQLELLALGMCTFVLVLGSVPDPHALAPKLALGVAAGACFGMLYRLGPQPFVSGTPALLLSVIPFIIIGALARAHPRLAIPAVDLNMCFWLGSQAGQPAQPDTLRILVESGALAAGALLIAGLFLVRPKHRNRLSREALSALRRNLLRILQQPGSRERWDVMTRAKILRLALHLARSPALGAYWPLALLDSLNLGHCLISHSTSDTATRARVSAYLSGELSFAELSARCNREANPALARAIQGAAPLLERAT